MILDFKEIPQANKGDGLQDTFELFTRDFLEILGYKIIQQPDRGADGKKDLIVLESRPGLSGVSQIKWLVSCKHYAHSGKSVSDTDEPNITDRVSVHDCNGFLGFYSTLPATSLGKNFKGLNNKIEIQSFDREKIEKELFATPQGLKLASRYFPDSFKKYSMENPKPAKIFPDEPEICCEYCKANLLDETTKELGIFVILRRMSDNEGHEYKKEPYIKAYFSCKGKCDHILKNKYSHEEMLIDEWADISDYLTPTGYIIKVMAWMNSMQIDNEKLESEAFGKLKKLLLNTFPYISRELTSKERERIIHLLEIGLADYI